MKFHRHAVKRFFITGIGTDIGKTFLACRLIRQARARNFSIGALKPVISGFDPEKAEASDSGLLLAALGLPCDETNLDRISPWRFRAPLAPDMAAALEARAIPWASLLAFCRAESQVDYCLIEGAGGVMVPLDDTHTTLDLMAALDATAILVTGTYLGAISHTLTAAGMLLARGVALRAVVVNASPAAVLSPGAMVAALARFLPQGIQFHTIAHFDSALQSSHNLPDLTLMLND